MPDLLQKCAVCGALLDEEDLFCANCGTEAAHSEKAEPGAAADAALHSFQCTGCGASMAYDPQVQALRCPFCGSEQLAAQPAAKTLAARRVIPFAVDQSRAVGILRQWLGRGFWRPNDLATAAVVAKMAAVYVPYWVFQARTLTYWTADTSQAPPGSRSGWYPLCGENRSCYAGLLVGASGVLRPGETSSLGAFDLQAAKAPAEVSRENVIIEQFRVPRKYARPLAQHGLEELERQACRQYVPGQCRNLKVNVRLEDLTSEPVLVPVWMMAYRYQGQVFRFLINGQTGQASGQAPVSWGKVVGAIAIVVLLALVLFLGLLGLAATSLGQQPMPAATERLAETFPCSPPAWVPRSLGSGADPELAGKLCSRDEARYHSVT